ncbi:MAG: hypothetical protein QTN59_00920 [Candidatus Electrothrix communis]|nr:hypothetical protein [Desulfobulbus sp. US4]WLE97401.1 MAG: hypothetical protein QTN59_00920 [Candidatus Electrothrix communis]
MSFVLSEIVPWGRSYDEYLSMFSLAPQDLQRSNLGVFSAEYRTTIQRTAYEFQEGGNEMLIIFSPAAAAR